MPNCFTTDRLNPSGIKHLPKVGHKKRKQAKHVSEICVKVIRYKGILPLCQHTWLYQLLTFSCKSVPIGRSTLPWAPPHCLATGPACPRYIHNPHGENTARASQNFPWHFSWRLPWSVSAPCPATYSSSQYKHIHMTHVAHMLTLWNLWGKESSAVLFSPKLFVLKMPPAVFVPNTRQSFASSILSAPGYLLNSFLFLIKHFLPQCFQISLCVSLLRPWIPYNNLFSLICN